jgi:hypothetical protein
MSDLADVPQFAPGLASHGEPALPLAPQLALAPPPARALHGRISNSLLPPPRSLLLVEPCPGVCVLNFVIRTGVT